MWTGRDQSGEVAQRHIRSPGVTRHHGLPAHHSIMSVLFVDGIHHDPAQNPSNFTCLHPPRANTQFSPTYYNMATTFKPGFQVLLPHTAVHATCASKS